MSMGKGINLTFMVYLFILIFEKKKLIYIDGSLYNLSAIHLIRVGKKPYFNLNAPFEI